MQDFASNSNLNLNMNTVFQMNTAGAEGIEIINRKIVWPVIKTWKIY